MYHLLTALFVLICSVGFSQKDSLLISTELPVDSIFYQNTKLQYIQENDSLIKSATERKSDSKNNLVIYSRKKRYEIDLPADPVTAFPAEWTIRNAEYPLTIYITINKGECTVMKASGSAVSIISPLAVYDHQDNLIIGESCGVRIIKSRHTKKK